MGRGRVVMDGSEAVAMLGTGQDITEQRQVERLREDILSAVSHELRTPLTSVLGFALTLEKHRDTLSAETIDETVIALADAARRLDRLLADLLDVERLRRGLVVLAREPVAVGELVERVVAECAVDGRELRVSTASVVAEVDQAKIERIVENLVVNAAKHTPAGTPIDVRLETADRDLLLVVEDHGPGIPDEFKEAVFETFNRGPNILALTPGRRHRPRARRPVRCRARWAMLGDGHRGRRASFHVLLPDCVHDAQRPAADLLGGFGGNVARRSPAAQTAFRQIPLTRQQRLEQVRPDTPEERRRLLLAEVERPPRAAPWPRWTVSVPTPARRWPGDVLARRTRRRPGRAPTGGGEATLAQREAPTVEGVAELAVAVQGEQRGGRQRGERKRGSPPGAQRDSGHKCGEGQRKRPREAA